MDTYSLEDFTTEVAAFVRWYRDHRSHQGLGGATPREVLIGAARARDAPRFETRRRLAPRSSGAELRAEPGVVLELDVRYFKGKPHLPIVALKQAA